jgi:L-alanine-DL-glutamate epimerase-like enolase superfamily enzyme
MTAQVPQPPTAPGLALGFELAALDALVYRVPVDEPVRTSFGVMHERPALLVRARAQDGSLGWGEAWCNFPAVGAEHRARLVASVIAPQLVGHFWDSPTAATNGLEAALRVLAIQSGEPGPLAQVCAAVDVALWDLVARRAAIPLWRLFGGTRSVRVYASGINPEVPEEVALRKHDEGFRAFKLKVGFGAERDVANLRRLREALGTDTPLMIDANQAWAPAEALQMSRALAQFMPRWLEEPIAADQPLAAWRELAHDSPVPLAAGENLRGMAGFAEVIEARVLRFVQPDIGKWGGYSGCLEVARRARARDAIFCPHWLGGGIGLAASLHLLAAAGGNGYAEWDANPNPLRELLAPALPRVEEGRIELSDAPGLGGAPDLEAAERFRVRVD